MVLGGKIKVLQEAFQEAFLDEPSGLRISRCVCLLFFGSSWVPRDPTLHAGLIGKWRCGQNTPLEASPLFRLGPLVLRGPAALTIRFQVYFRVLP